MGGILWISYLVQRQVGGDDQRLPAAVSAVHDVVDIRISARPFESFGFYHCSDDLLPSEDTDWHGR